MGKASEIWKEVKPKIGEMLAAVNDIETRAEKAQEEAYQKGLSDAWEAARKIRYMTWKEQREVFGTDIYTDIIALSASEAIEKIRQYEQPVTAEDVMRQYLDTFCTHNKSCVGCPLNTPDFTCGRGYHFLTAEPVSDEEVRRAYAKVLRKMRGE